MRILISAASLKACMDRSVRHNDISLAGTGEAMFVSVTMTTPNGGVFTVKLWRRPKYNHWLFTETGCTKSETGRVDFYEIDGMLVNVYEAPDGTIVEYTTSMEIFPAFR